MSDSSESSSPAVTPNSDDQHDYSHVSEDTRLRMQRVRDLEQQRLRRVLAQSRTHVQGADPVNAPSSSSVPQVPRSLPVAESNAQEQSSSSNRRNRSRVVSITHKRSPKEPLESITSISPETDSVVQDAEETSHSTLMSNVSLAISEAIGGANSEEASNTEEGIQASNRTFIEKLKAMADNAQSEEMKTRYLRLYEMEERKLAEGPVSRADKLVSRLSRSSSFKERSRSNRMARANSMDQSNRVEPILAPVAPIRAPSQDSIVQPILDGSAFDKFLNRREEGLKRIEELRKRREQGHTGDISSPRDARETSSYLSSFSNIPRHSSPPLSRRSNDNTVRRSSETPIHYSSITELTEPSIPFSRQNLSSMSRFSGSLENIGRRTPDREPRDGGGPITVPWNRLPSTRVTREIPRSTVMETSNESKLVTHTTQDLTQGIMYVDVDGTNQWMPPTSPKYQSFIAEESHTDRWERSRELEEKKRRSLLRKEGIGDHVLMECFDPDFTFEERIASIREKLYGSRVLIPSDKKPKESRGSPDGASEAAKLSQKTAT